jgi:hypothetical protein
VRPLGSHAELLAASGDDQFVRWQVRADVPLQAWDVGGAVAFLRTRAPGRRQLTVLGAPRAAAAVVLALIDDAAPAGRAQGITVPFGTLPLLGHGLRIGPGDDWDWMWADASTIAGLSADDRVECLADDARDDVTALLAAASPRHSSDPGDPDVRAWYGVRDSGGELVACAAHAESVPGVPHLAEHLDGRSVLEHDCASALAQVQPLWWALLSPEDRVAMGLPS